MHNQMRGLGLGLLLALAGLSGCCGAGRCKAKNAAAGAEVQAAMEEWFRGYAARDINAVMALTIPDDRAVFVGMADGATAVGAEELRKGLASQDFASCERLEVRMTNIVVQVRGSAAWLFADCAYDVTADGRPLQFPARLTAVFEKRQGRWLLAQGHCSVPKSTDF